ncbi:MULTISPECIES: flagellar hook-length control protein FliK [Pseudidiomarina]|uniref:Flagellar hook-length control protein FliK n=2 Tax=Pseudidiomarina TaxID=2800384 RepID=A0A368V2C9_9GAMM|nr:MULTISPECIES: flagellar hook-length control protein FliK [Pseudidiomarina]PWW13753.1 flagellar hook-length control protein FliK [Pseudidiomarina maritima]RBP91147.1 flagellar hook-length control protein FliK [Pseudidiomarina tainanensis]RCW33161.1 flagellar hook-length control protein FliK [Pseudidiomarina tainanensis]
MSSITPLLDTLVHQVAKQRSPVAALPRHPLPVAPIQAAATTTEFSQAGQQVARLLQLIDSWQQQLPPRGSQSAFIQTAGQLFPAQATNLNVAALVSKLQTLVKDSGVFYETLLARWAAQKAPINLLQQQPQNRTPSTIQSILGQQIDLLNSGMLRIETELWPQATLQWLVQPEVNPLVQRWRDEQRRQQGDEPEAAAWTSEIKLSLPALGVLRAKLRLGDQHLTMQVQCTESQVQLVRSQVDMLAQRLRQITGLQVDPIAVGVLANES